MIWIKTFSLLASLLFIYQNTRIDNNFTLTSIIHASAPEIAVADVHAITKTFKVNKLHSLPNIRDKTTVVNLAIMTSNAYTLPNKTDWLPPSADLNYTFGYGRPGLRGHIFTSRDTAIIAIKGTSPGLFGIGGDTSELDRYHDNLMFSCCCARIDFTWPTVCPCYRGYNATSKKNICDKKCLLEYSRNNTYLDSARMIYQQTKTMHPKKSVWVTGHSLGGAISALLANELALPAVTFEAPGDYTYSRRINQTESRSDNIYHFGNTADPVFIGQCKGPLSPCYVMRYAMESKYHLGKECVYETGSGLDIRLHTISQVISRVLMPASRVPECKAASRGEDECSNDWVYE